MVDAFALYDATMAALAAVGLAYLLYSERFVVAYRGFLRALAAGLFAFSVVATVLALLPGDYPGDALLGPFVLPSLYVLVRSQVGTDRGTGALEAAFGRGEG